MSVLDVYTSDVQLNYYKRYKDNHQRLYNKWTTASSTTHSTSYTITSKSSSSFEVLFSKLFDALIFTSALAITAYSYLTGTLVEPITTTTTTTNALPAITSPPIIATSTPHISSRYESSSRYQRRRTQEWAEQQLLSTPLIVKKRSCSTSKVQPDNTMMKREKKRTKSLPVNKLEPDQEDERFSRMEEKLHSLIMQGQEALSSDIRYVVEN